MKKFEILWELPKCDRHQVSKCCWKNGTNRLAQWRVTTNLHFVKKNAVSVKHNQVKCNKIWYACTQQGLHVGKIVWKCHKQLQLSTSKKHTQNV